ncbi:MAG: DUF1570 domain-containing protein [Planctomycetota bacterium]
MCALVILAAIPVAAMDTVRFQRAGKPQEVVGRLMVTSQDGGVLLMAQDGLLWAIPPQEKPQVTSDDRPFEALPADEIARRVLAELPAGFEVHRTQHYLIVHNTSRGYAQWCGGLFERLYMAFTNYWSRKGFDIKEPELPLVAVIFKDRPAYLKHAERELGGSADSIIGYYHLLTNRMTMFDLTGTEVLRRGDRTSTAATVNQVLSRPGAQATVATIVHEATHQIAYNCGLHVRLSGCPLWLAEGVAMYFETPDLTSERGWRGIGNVNYSRLRQLQKYWGKRPRDSLKALIAGDSRLRDPDSSLDAYAESWALVYFLVNQYPRQFGEYLKLVSQKKALIEDSEEKRLEEFTRVFGELEKLDAELARYLNKLR